MHARCWQNWVGLRSSLDGTLEYTDSLVSHAGGIPSWKLGSNHSAVQWQNKMRQRGWTPDQITEAIQTGTKIAAGNLVNPANTATRYVHPTTGRSVVVDDVTEEVIHVG